MEESLISIDKPVLSIQYDPITNELTGDTEFKLTLTPLNDEATTEFYVNIEHSEDLIVTPNPVEASARPKTVTVSLAPGVEPTELGNYNFGLKFTNKYSKDIESDISLKVEEKNEPDIVFEYKLKYYIQRQGYRLHIYQNVESTTILEPIEINGTVELNYKEREYLYEPIISSSLKINLECSLERDFQDLYSEDEKTFKVEVIKYGNTVFLGFILPDGIWQDFVSDKWNLTLNAVDGLSSLKNISFSNDNGLNFYGRMSILNIFNICLKKTGFDLRVNVLCYLEYLNYSNYNIFAYTFLSTERYFQNSNRNDSEPMDCETVMKSILQCFNATIEMRNGEWFIYRSTDLKDINLVSQSFHTYTNNNIELYFGETIGSEINGFEKFHCNGNQKISISPTIQAYQISYTYGGSRNILANGGLIYYGLNRESIYGIDMPGWEVLPAPDGANHVLAGVTPTSNYGVNTNLYNNSGNSLFLQLVQHIDILQNDTMVLTVDFRNIEFNSTHLRFAFGIVDGSNNHQYYNIQTGKWGGAGVMNEVANYYQPTQNSYKGKGNASVTVEATAPSNGRIFISFYRNKSKSPIIEGPSRHSISRVSLSASANNIKSKDYTGLRTKKISTAVKSDITVYNGDSESDLFVGTIYKYDSDTPTSQWNRYYYYYDGSNFVKNYYPESKELLEINAEDNLRISRRPMEIFEGDFKGFIPHLNFIKIDGRKFYDTSIGQLVDKKFMFSKYSYSFDTDITKMVAKEYSDQYIFGEDQYKVIIKENYSNESKVTIKTV